MPKVLIIDDERPIRSTLKDILEYEKLEIDEAEDGRKGLKKIEEGNFDLVLCDIKMPAMDGLEVLKKAQEIKPDLPFVMISGHGTIETAVDAIKSGAYDYIAKPPDLNRLLVTVRNALEHKSLVKETNTLRRKVTADKSSPIIGNSSAIMEVKEMIEKVAPTEARVLITGPNGVGKELVAQQIHKKSKRSRAPFIEVNCAAIPAELIESELFGHEKGSFTSAIKQRIGKFEQAKDGTLFLDEIGDMSPSAQAKVLRALQENKIVRVGGEKEISVSPRVIAATNKDLQKEIEEGDFREDLYHRLSVIKIEVPPLNERRDDIPILIHHFLDQISALNGQKTIQITSQAIDKLKARDWSGNIRELRNIVERLMIMASDKIDDELVKKYA